jgi:hypothetical protein
VAGNKEVLALRACAEESKDGRACVLQALRKKFYQTLISAQPTHELFYPQTLMRTARKAQEEASPPPVRMQEA